MEDVTKKESVLEEVDTVWREAAIWMVSGASSGQLIYINSML